MTTGAEDELIRDACARLGLLATIREMGDESNRADLHPLFALLAYTGLRRGEALGLRWSDVDLGRRMITVRRSYDGQTKSSKHRVVPVESPN